MFRSLEVFALAIFFAALASSAMSASSLKAQYNDAMRISQAQPAEAFDAIQTLAKQGYAPAWTRLGYFLANGHGTTPDREAAKEAFVNAHGLGHHKSLLPLAKILVADQKPAEALTRLDEAVSLDVQGAAAMRAYFHALRKFSDLSDRQRGWQDLTDLANAQDRMGAINLLLAAAKEKTRLKDIDPVLMSLHGRAKEGDGKAAEALLKYLRTTSSRDPRFDQLRQDLVTHPKVRAKVALEEELYLAVEQRPEAFWTASAALLKPAKDDAFERGLVVTAKLNKNAYVRVLQSQLSELGYYQGRRSGYLTKSTVRANLAFCRDAGIIEDCKVGLLKSRAVKSVSKALVAMSLAGEPS